MIVTFERRVAEAHLVTVVTRLAVDHLPSVRVRREQYIGPWLPDPLPAKSERFEGQNQGLESLRLKSWE